MFNHIFLYTRVTLTLSIVTCEIFKCFQYGAFYLNMALIRRRRVWYSSRKRWYQYLIKVERSSINYQIFDIFMHLFRSICRVFAPFISIVQRVREFDAITVWILQSSFKVFMFIVSEIYFNSLRIENRLYRFWQIEESMTCFKPLCWYDTNKLRPMTTTYSTY